MIVAGSILGVLLVAIGVVALLRAVAPAEQNPYVIEPESSQTEAQNESQSTNESDEEESQDATQDQAASKPETTIDPATVNTVDIAPMALTVSYVKGVGGFEYEVLRASNGTRYVEFRSPDLVSSKCTNDNGTFASIIASPTENENTDLAATTEVEGEKYGLSLAGATCASDTTLLQKYQKSFSDAFSLLKKMN